jgi:rod shape-determining protein MreC
MHGFFNRHRIVFSCGFFLFLSLLLAATNSRTPGRVDPVGVLLLEVMHPFQMGMATVSKGAGQLWESYIALWSLRQQNAELRRRVAELEALSQRAVELGMTNQRLSAILRLQDEIGGRGVAARVVGRSPSAWVHTLVLDKGERDGVGKGMAVLAPEGVVGQVISASAHAARVLLVSDPNSGVDVLVQRSRVQGIAAGVMERGCALKYIQRGSDIAIGDAVVTSGLDGIFPKGQPVGNIVRIDTKDSRMFQDVEVKLSAELAKVEEVLVVAPGVVRAGE